MGANFFKISKGTTLAGQGSAPSSPVDGDIYYDTGLNQFQFRQNGSFIAIGSGSGTVTSVALTVPAFLSVAGSPITTSGTLAVSFSGTAIPVANGGTGDTSLTLHGVLIGNGTSGITVSSVGSTGTVLHGNTGADPTFSAVSLTADVSGVLPLANGGTNANLTASNGAVVYSTGSALALSAVGSSGQILQSAGATTPVFSTATYPSTGGTSGTILRSDGTNFLNTSATYPNSTTINRILFSSATNTISEITTANTSALVTNSTGVPSLTSGTTANRLLRTNGTTVSFAQADLTTDVTGTLPVANGGTGDTSLTAHGVLIGNGTSGVTVSSVGANNTVLHGNTGADPTFSAVSLTADVSGTLPIANGGTGQTTANPAFNALSPLTTKGDILSYSTVNARLAVGTNAQVLTADSTQTLGVKWATPAAGSVTFIGGISYTGVSGCVWDYSTTSYANASAVTACNTGTLSGSASDPGSKIPAVKFSSLNAGTYWVVVDGYYTGDGSTESYFRISDGSTTSGFCGSNSGAGVAGSHLQGFFVYGSTQTNITFQIQGLNTTAAGNLSHIRDNNANITFSINVYQIS